MTCAGDACQNQHVAGLLFILIFNLATFVLLRVVLKRADLTSMLSEKAPLPVPKSGQVDAGGQGGGNAGAPAAAGGAQGNAPPDTSYSRVAGLIGAIILSTFLWAVSNVLLYTMMFGTAADIGSIVGVVPQVLLPGATLFAPYAVNQLRSSFTG